MAKFKLNVPLLRTIIPICDKWKCAGITKELEEKILADGECSMGLAKVLAETFECDVRYLAAPKKRYSKMEQCSVISDMDDYLTENISGTYDIQYIIAAENQRSILKYIYNKL